MPGFLEGFANKASQKIDEFTQDKLKMAMISKQMEMEANARQQEDLFKNSLGKTPAAQTAGLAEILGARPEQTAKLSSLFPQGVGAEENRALMSGLAQQIRGASMANKPQLKTYTDPNNKVHQVAYSPMTGETLWDHETGLDPHSAEKAKASETGAQSTLQILQGMQQRLQSVLTKIPGYVPGQEAKIRLQNVIPYDPELKAALDGQAGRVMAIQKALAGTAGRNWEMIKAEMQGYGDGSDTIASMNRKINDKIQDIKNTNSATLQTYDPTNYLHYDDHPAAIGASKNKNQLLPNTGGYGTNDFAQEDLRRAALKPQKQVK